MRTLFLLLFCGPLYGSTIDFSDFLVVGHDKIVTISVRSDSITVSGDFVDDKIDLYYTVEAEKGWVINTLTQRIIASEECVRFTGEIDYLWCLGNFTPSVSTTPSYSGRKKVTFEVSEFGLLDYWEHRYTVTKIPEINSFMLLLIGGAICVCFNRHRNNWPGPKNM